MSQMRKHKRSSICCERAADQGQAPRNLLVAMHWLVVDSHQVGVLHFTRPDHRNIRSEKEKDHQQTENCMCLPAVRISLGSKMKYI